MDGLRLAAGVGAVVLLATAVAAWFLLKGQKLEDGTRAPRVRGATAGCGDGRRPARGRVARARAGARKPVGYAALAFVA